MSEPSSWAEVDDYIVTHLIGSDGDLDAATADARAAGLPPIAVSAAQGKFLHLLAQSIGAQRVLEIGTLGGYSTIWLARALPDHGRLISLELDPHHAQVATANVRRAGQAHKVDIRVGPALQSLPHLADEITTADLFGGELFDFVFIDADKVNIPAYFDWSVKLSRPGGVIVVDNVVRDGKLASPQAAASDEAVQGVRTLHEHLAGRTDVSATTIQTVGDKGYDGFTLAMVDKRQP